MSGSNVMRWAGLSAVVAGVLLAVTQMIHPERDPSSVTTSSWAITHSLEVGMAVFTLLGISGLYARQVEKAGLLGLVGFLMWFVALAVFANLAFFEAFILPLLATEAPQFIAGFLAIFTGGSLGALLPILVLSGLLYSVGVLLFGIATLRAGILPRWAAIVLIIGVVLGLLAILLGEVVGRIGSVALGLGLAWLGYALWSEQREKASEPSPAVQS